MKTFLVITKIKTEEVRDSKSASRFKVDDKGRKYFYVNTYLETWKYIIETNNKININEHFKKSSHRLVNVQEIEPFKKVERNKKGANTNSSAFSLGELFKDQLAGFNDKNDDQPYIKEKSKKQLKKKPLKEEKRYVKKKNNG